jgi:Domain of unknown function (DUF4386)
MSERAWTRIALLTAPPSVVLLVISFSLPGQIHGNESASEVVSLLVDNRTAVLTSIGLQIASNILFIPFVLALRRILRRSEQEPASLSTFAFTAGFIGAAVAVMANAMLAGITAKVAVQLQQSEPNLVWALVQVYKSVGYSIDLFFGLFVLATSLLLVRSAIGPRWVGWLGFLPGSLWVLATFTVIDPEGIIGLAGFIGALLVSLWILLLSLAMLPRAGATEMQARVAATVQG